MHNLSRLAILALAILGLSAQALSAAETPYEIDVILSATGPGSFLGAAQTQALGLLEEQTNSNRRCRRSSDSLQDRG